MVIVWLLLLFLAVLVIRALQMKGRPLSEAKPTVSQQEAEDYARQLGKMIACQTVSVKGSFEDTEFAKLRAVVAELFPLVHQHCEKLTFSDDCWIYKLKGADESRNIMLMSHHDVVAAEGEWQHPPFAGEIADGKLWGRGTVDTKTPLFAEFAALEALLAGGYTPKCNVWIGSSCNEEIAGDGIPLANAYFKEHGITFDLILDEGGAVIDPPISGMACQKCAMVAIHEKGRHKLVLTASAGSAHVGLTAGMKATPAERMAAFITEFRKKNIFIRRLNPQVRGMFRAMAPYASFPMKLIFANLWCFGPLLTRLLPKISAQAGGLLGTTCAFNDVVTSENGKVCTAKVMLRSVDDKDLETDLQNFRDLAAKYGIEVTEGEDSEYHAPADPTLPPFAVVSACIREVFPDVPVIPFILPAGTDARTLTDVCPCVLRFAPIRLSAQQLASVHSENENIDVTAVGDCVSFYRCLLKQYEK